MKKYTGYEYLLIDVANHYGLDKMLFEERIKWTRANMKDLEGLMHEADEPIRYIKAVMSLRDVQAGRSTGHMVGLDACSSGLQIMGALIGCRTTCENTGLINPNVRADIYTKTTQVMGRLLGQKVEVIRDDVKQAQMTHFYGSKAKPIEIFGEDTDELEAFYLANHTVAPGACDLMEDLIGSWQPYSLVHKWDLPDGFHARIKVMQKVEAKIEVDELDHATFTHLFQVNEGSEFGVSLAANIIHSIDGMIVREMNRRCNYDVNTLLDAQLFLDKLLRQRDPTEEKTKEFVSLVHVENLRALTHKDTPFLNKLRALVNETLTRKSFPIVTIHDCFQAHPNNMNTVRQTYIDIFGDIAESDMLADIMSQILGEPVNIVKYSTRVGGLIRGSNYALA